MCAGLFHDSRSQADRQQGQCWLLSLDRPVLPHRDTAGRRGTAAKTYVRRARRDESIAAMPSVLIEVRREYSEVEEIAILDAVHGALVAAFLIPPEDKNVR